MPVTRIDFDDTVVTKEEVKQLATGIHEILVAATDIEDVPVYANSSEVSYKIAPIEIFVQLSDNLVPGLDAVTERIKTDLKQWRVDNDFKHTINLSFIPMRWKIEIDI
jgi:hypothetical protein